MRKLLKLFAVAVPIIFSFNVYGVTNLKVNNSSALVTVTTNDTLHITGDFQASGAIGRVILYYDLNANGVLDAGEAWTAKFRLIDGNFADDDGLANGAFHVIYDPVTITGRFILYAEDGGISATVPLQINPITSSLSVSGTITTPANTPHIFVAIGDTINGIQYLYGTFTNGSGAYSISLPQIFNGAWSTIIAADMVGVLPAYYMSNVVTDINILGAETKNFDIFNVSTVDSTIVSGTVRDDLGNVITDPVQIVGGSSNSGTTNLGVRRITDTSGQFKFAAPKYATGIYLSSAVAVVDQFYPQYLDPLYRMKVGVGLPSCSLNIMLYHTNDSICGTVYKDSLPYRYAQIDIGAIYPAGMTQGTYTKTYSDGHYVAYVSQAVTIYGVRVDPKSIPQNYVVLEGDTMQRMYGSVGVDFHLVDTVAVEENKTDIGKLVMVQPNPFVNSVRFEFTGKEKLGNLRIYDIAGNQVTEVMPEYSGTGASFVLSANREKMPAGVYFYSLKSPNKTYEGKLIRL